MREYSNIDISGDLKLRHGAKERILVDSHFYSDQFGQAAYKTDIITSSDASKFYGISTKLSNDNTSVLNIGLLTLADEFYISQNSPNTDEVIVNLGSDGVRTVQCDNNLKYAGSPNTTLPFQIINCNIPSNTLVSNGAVRAESWGLIKTRNALVTYRLIVNINGAAVYDDTDSINTIAISIPWKIDLLLYQTSPTRAGLSGNFVLSTNVAGDPGVGSLAGQVGAQFGNFDFAHDITVGNNLTVTISLANANAIDKFYRHCAYVEVY